MPYRVVQWATGNIGTRALREIIRDPALDLAGVLVYDPAKDGIDAGELCGEAPTGVRATTDPARVIALDAECVLHMPRRFDVDDVVALLERGTNVITTRGELFGAGRRLEATERKRLFDACARGNASAFATGSSPGFITDALPFALLSLQRRVDAIEIEEFANVSRRDSPHLLFNQMGFGQPLDSYDARRAAYLLGEFQPALASLAEAAGRPADDWRADGAVAAAAHATELLAGRIEAGTIGAQRTTLVGMRDGAPVVQFTANWYCTTDLDPAWELQATGWHVRVRGDAAIDVTLEFPVALDDLAAVTPGYTAHRAVNAIPAVCAAPPGLLSAYDLPSLTPARPLESA